MSNTPFSKIATLKVKNGTYKKDGVEKNRYNEVGVLLSSPHGSQLIISLHATATSEQKYIYIANDKGVHLRLEREDSEEELGEDVVPVDGEVPF
ncbi:hypothetical protein IKF63_01195 [Candidatus Saccharibacteria bacterium]|nr:hypothetical protein [Candidatus Saccharibacteria bacterium]MBR3180678.1 hypothetical protein [Candidatus Saccharibacteria bacterium]